jgi:hypothetical protein
MINSPASVGGLAKVAVAQVCTTYAGEEIFSWKSVSKIIRTVNLSPVVIKLRALPNGYYPAVSKICRAEL